MRRDACKPKRDNRVRKKIPIFVTRERRAAEDENFFRSPICRGTLTTFPEYGVLKEPIADESGC